MVYIKSVMTVTFSVSQKNRTEVLYQICFDSESWDVDKQITLRLEVEEIMFVSN